jgi:hypothetical protein
VPRASFASVVLLGLRLLLPEALSDLRIPISVILMNGLAAFSGIVGIRVLRRAAWERNLRRQRAARNATMDRSTALLVGVGAAGVMAVREIRSRGAVDMDRLTPSERSLPRFCPRHSSTAGASRRPSAATPPAPGPPDLVGQALPG